MAQGKRPRYHSVCERPWNRQSVRPQFGMGSSIVPQPEKYKESFPLRGIAGAAKPRREGASGAARSSATAQPSFESGPEDRLPRNGITSTHHVRHMA